MIAEHYQVEQSECLLFDDDYRNVKDTDGLFTAVQVSTKYGFDLENLPFKTSRLKWLFKGYEGQSGGVLKKKKPSIGKSPFSR